MDYFLCLGNIAVPIRYRYLKSSTRCQFANIGLQVTNEVRSSPKKFGDLISAVFFFTCITEHSLCHSNMIRLREGVTKDFARDKRYCDRL